MSPEAPSLVGETVDERWKLLEQLGAGGMGVVYRAERLKLGRAVAIKFLDERAARTETAVARFDREARAISRLRHRHIVDITDFGVWRRRPYIVMEYVAGRPLNKEMGKREMTPARGVRIMVQILEALRHAHASGVVHRDLKPENVMLAETTGEADFVKLLDFGLAIIVGDEQPSISVPRTIAGTPSYMSPEQARGERPDHRADIYSCGIILFAMCAGQKPFRAEDPMDLLRMHLRAPRPSPRKVAPQARISVELERVILRAMEIDADKRFFTAGDFLAALERVPEMRKAHRSRGRSLAALLMLAGLGGVGAWALGARARVLGIATPPSPLAPSLTPKPLPKPVPKPVPKIELYDLSRPSLPDLAPAPRPELAGAASAPTPPVPAPTLPSPPPIAVPLPTERERIGAFIDADQLDEAERNLRAQAILEPKAGWVHLDLGEIYFRRTWRRDAEKEWDRALTLDPALRSDARLGEHLCPTLAPAWKGTAQRLVVRHIGSEAVAPLHECIRHADNVERVQAAARLIERVGARKLDRALVTQRLAELRPKKP
jgi:serine/threonine-protein kinase